MFAAKTIKCKVIGLTGTKQKILQSEYDNLQVYLQSLEDLGVYSANKQQADRFYKVIKPDKEYPISIRKDCIDIKETDNKLAKYWAKVPVKSCRGGLKVAIKPHQPFPKDCKICESKLFIRNGNWWLYVSIKKEVKIKSSYSSILAIDIGEKVTATTVLSYGKQGPMFYGREMRGIRRHYAWLRKRLGNKKLLKKIKQIGHKEQRRTNQILHEIAKDVTQLAANTGSVIVLGDLKGIRKSAKDKGKRMNRIVGNMSHFKLTQFITYKANWAGIQVVKVNERGTSITCSECGERGKRPYQGLFKCPSCGYQANADYNGAKNILKRGLETISSSDGVRVAVPVTPGVNQHR